MASSTPGSTTWKPSPASAIPRNGRTRAREGRLEPHGQRQLEPRQGGKLRILANLFANPNLPQIDDYYEPYTYDYEHLKNAPLSQTPPTARPVSVLTGKKMDKIHWGPNWEDDLGGEFSARSRDQLFEGVQKEMYSTSRTPS